MTGSGKTGLCISLLEEAAIDGIPSIVIDPKVDLPNLLLTFPQLRGEDFGPWVNEDDARIKGVSPDEYARQQADLCKKGLAEWGQDGERIKRLREASDLEKFPADEAMYADLPSEAGKVKSYGIWSRSFADWLFRNQKIELFKSPSLKTLSKPNESERDFRIRLQEASREERDQLVERLRQKYAPKIAALEERIRRAEQAIAREEEQAKQQKLQTAISFGTTLLGAFLGKKRVSVSTLGRATTAVRGVGRTMKESQDIDRAEETLAVLKNQLAEFEARFQAETERKSQQGLVRRQNPLKPLK